MFFTRYRFHKDIYNHKTVKLIEVMLGDALLYADNYYNFSEISSSDLLKYDDSIYNTLLFTDNKELYQSKNIIERIEKRNLYKQLWSGASSSEEIEDLTSDRFPDCKLTDLRTISMKFNYCNGNSSPLNNIKFENGGSIIKGNDIYVDKLMPSVYEEKTFMIYSIK